MSEAPREPEAPTGDPVRIRRFGDYQVFGVIGRGGMGVVYAARRVSTGERVALKLLAPRGGVSPGLVERFEREARAARRIDDPGVVQILDAGQHEGTRYIAMAFVPGAPLDLVITLAEALPYDELTGAAIHGIIEANLRPSTTWLDTAVEVTARVGAASASIWRRDYVGAAVELVARVADALEQVHRAGVVHRDVKPSNILLRADGSVVLTDFGLARDSGDGPMAAPPETTGTAQYMAPEQFLFDEVDHRVDIFGLGATLYELLTLRMAFDGEDRRQVIDRVLSAAPEPPHRINPHVDRRLSAVVGRALAKDPRRRYRTARDLALALRDTRRPATAVPAWLDPRRLWR